MARVRYLGILYCVVGRSENLVPPPLSFFGRTVNPISRPNSLDCTDLKISVEPAVTQNCVASVTYNPISTRWADYDHHSTTSPPEFSDLTTALISTVQGCHRESKLGKTTISQWCSAAAASSLEN